jgi:hypothetical protein
VSALKTLNSVVFWAALALFPVSCWNCNDLPEGIPLADGILRAPLQTQATASPFSVASAVRHAALRGVVVSCGPHDGNHSLHRLWNDHINVADLCVVPGDNADDPT